MKIQLITLGLLLAFTTTGIAQDTLNLNLQDAERMFITQNYQLLAQKFQTEQAKAEIITARLFDNPELSYDNLLYNHETRKFLGTSMSTGQYAVEISQIIKLAGKRNKNIQLATIGVKLNEYAYFDLMRTLRFDLRSTFYKAYYAQQSASIYQQQIQSLEQLLEAFEEQLKLGNIASKDIIRIKSLVYNLKGEYIDLLNGIDDLETTIKLLTNINPSIDLKLVEPQFTPGDYLQKLPYSQLLDSAIVNRADLQLAKTELLYAQQNLKLQRAMAIPDIEFSLDYDLKGNYPEKYTGIGIKIPIPMFNRNQGEIKKAMIAIDIGDTNLRQQELSLENEVYNSYKAALRIENLYQSLDQDFSNDFDQLIAEATKNFKNRNISLIEFLDLYDAYKENTLQLNTLRYERMKAKEEINFVTGSSIFKN